MSLTFFETLGVSLFSGVLGGMATFWVQERKLARELQLQDQAEKVAHELLNHPDWTLRTFKIICHHLGGFEDDEVRKMLVRAGAVRFKSKSGVELWGLLQRNRDKLSVPKLDIDIQVVDEELFGVPGKGPSK